MLTRSSKKIFNPMPYTGINKTIRNVSNIIRVSSTGYRYLEIFTIRKHECISPAGKLNAAAAPIHDEANLPAADLRPG